MAFGTGSFLTRVRPGLLVNERYGDVTTATILIYANSTAFIDLPGLPPSHDLHMVGQTISHYHIVEKLGARGS
ncbi:MAG: hypothetical protein ABSC15_04015 [Terriglobales bacterium]|jgi:hypothetical protein